MAVGAENHERRKFSILVVISIPSLARLIRAPFNMLTSKGLSTDGVPSVTRSMI